MGMEVGAVRSEGLKRGDDPRHPTRLARRLGEHLAKRLPRRLRHQAMEFALALDEPAKRLGDGEHHVAMGHVEQHLFDKPLGEERRSLGLA